ncbi:hydrolase [Marivirga lumbricoides]|uniref:Hydrolase n=1 Tax=Marivirga lumbricoides TaxID=1046115 RepID=A0ABQ1LPH6_9BACT|nr:hydrolase [Marivirga lumbricoides]
MKIAAAQIKPIKGDIQQNIECHTRWIETAVSKKADFILFPELSLTAYEPRLAKKLAIYPDDDRFNIFQELSDLNNITIGVGAPTKSGDNILISMILFQPNQERKVYSKQKLHSDELPYFAEGKEQLMLQINDKKLAPAICYESILPAHAENAKKQGAAIYLVSVAKSQTGIEKGFVHYAEIAKHLSMHIVMSNSTGFCDNFYSAGQSAIWNSKGEVLTKLESDREGLIIFNTKTEKAFIVEEVLH